MKLKEKQMSIRLRRKGKSYAEIIRNVGVSKGTISLWLRGIELSPEQKKDLYVTKRQENAYRMAKANQKKRQEKIKAQSSLARMQVKKLSQNPLFAIGLMLY